MSIEGPAVVHARMCGDAGRLTAPEGETGGVGMDVYLPGWYNDGHGALRWWDGWAWTDHVAPLTPRDRPFVVHESLPRPEAAPADPYAVHSAPPVDPYAAQPASPPPPPDPYAARPAPASAPTPPAYDVVPYAPASAPEYPAPGASPYGTVTPYGVGPLPLAPNGVGVAGFVVGLVSLFLPLFVGLIGGLIGLGLSIAGVAQTGRRKGLAIAGLVLSIVAVIVII